MMEMSDIAWRKPGVLRRNLPAAALFLGGAVVGAVAARYGIQLLPPLGLTAAQTGVVIASLPLVYLLCVAGHEAGHVLFGRLADFRTLLYIAGPLRVERTPDGFEVGLNRSVLLSGGLAAMMPVGLHDLRRRTVVMVAGGPLASLMLGAQLLALYQATGSGLLRAGAPFAAQLMALVLLATGTISLFMGLITLVPGRSGGFYSDGARMLRLMRAGEDTEREVALLALAGMSMVGTRPRDWDGHLVERGAAIRDGGPFEVGGQQFAYAHALDRGDVVAARRHLEAALERIDQLPAAARASLALAAAAFHALYEGDAGRARGFLHSAGRGMLAAPHQRRLAEAAVHLAEGDVEAARRAAGEVAGLAARALDRGGAALDAALAGAIMDRSARHASVQEAQGHEAGYEQDAERPGQPVEVAVDEELDRTAEEVDEAAQDEEACGP
jgi:hypothetical protein